MKNVFADAKVGDYLTFYTRSLGGEVGKRTPWIRKIVRVLKAQVEDETHQKWSIDNGYQYPRSQSSYYGNRVAHPTTDEDRKEIKRLKGINEIEEALDTLKPRLRGMTIEQLQVVRGALEAALAVEATFVR